MRSELDRPRRELQAHRLLTERAESATAAERHARELAQQTMHEERAEKQTVALQLRELEQVHDETTVKLEQLKGAHFFARRRLLRELRAQASA